MCGIVGYVGQQAAAPVLLHGLSKLEYRGYDSAGIALSGAGQLSVFKQAGRLQRLISSLGETPLPQTVGIGHTRWATHGEPNDRNAHPQVSEDGRFAVVHNGIIENYAELKRELTETGISFRSDTDTEVVAQLLQREDTGDLVQTVRAVTARLAGSYALGILCADQPDTVVAVRHASPLIIGLTPHGSLLASDIPAILSFTRRFIVLDDEETAVLTAAGVTVYDRTGQPVRKAVQEVTWDIADTEKGPYDHFMIKEIFEQPEAVAAALQPYWRDGAALPQGLPLPDEALLRFRQVRLVACGSAYHAALVGKQVLETTTRLPVEAEVASEFRYRDPLVDEGCLVIVISQSGETADTLAALREAKRRGAAVLGIVNVAGSSVANESDYVLYTRAGPEISVATTKAYSAQLAVLYLLALYWGYRLGRLSEQEAGAMAAELKRLPDHLRSMLGSAPQIRVMAQRYAYLEHAYFIGRQLDRAVAMEAALKLKEISYIHAEAYPAGELKHGTISLIENGTFVVALACVPHTVEKTLSNVQEVKARGAEVLLLTTRDQRVAAELADHTVFIPRIHPLFTPSLAVVPLQLLSYYVALARGCDIDKPRNLAKSVTVE